MTKSFLANVTGDEDYQFGDVSIVVLKLHAARQYIFCVIDDISLTFTLFVFPSDYQKSARKSFWKEEIKN